MWQVVTNYGEIWAFKVQKAWGKFYVWYTLENGASIMQAFYDREIVYAEGEG